MSSFIQFLTSNKSRVIEGTWNNPQAIPLYRDYLAHQLGFTNIDDWYKLTSTNVRDNYGSALYARCGSTIMVLKFLFPAPMYEWVEWKFNRVPQGFWKNEENHKKFASWLGKQLGYTTPEDWYKIKLFMIHDNNGAGLVGHYYDDSPQKFVYKVVQTIYPDYTWLPWKFDNAPNNFWKDANNQKMYADWFGKENGYATYDDWYGAALQSIIKNHGAGLVVGYYDGSLYKFLKSVYPTHDWQPWKFNRTSNCAWTDLENRKKALIELEKKLGITTPTEWYDVDRQKIKDNGGWGLLSNYYNSSLARMITELFPEYNLKLTKFQKNYSTGSIEWLEYMKVSFPDMRHIMNHDAGEFIIPNSTFKADGFSMKDNMIFEYHGDFWHGNPKIYNPSDINQKAKKTYGELYENTLYKQQFCKKTGFEYKSIWDSEWIRGKNALIILQKKIKKVLHII